MPVKIERVVYLFSILVAVLLVGMFLCLAPQVFVADSEFWSIALGYYLKEEIFNNWVYMRPLFYFFLWLSQPPYQSATDSVLWARGLFALNALIMLFLMMQLMRRRAGSYIYGVVAVVLLLGNTGFLNQGFRIRSDLMATTLALMGLHLYFLKSHKWYILSPLLATPKAIIHVVSLLRIYYNEIQIFKSWKLKTALLLVLILLVFLNWSNLYYFFETFRSSSGGPGYFDPISFTHIKNQIVRNPLFWILFFVRFYIWKKAQSGQAESNEKTTEYFWIKGTICFFIWLLLFTEKVQFFIASFLPYFAMHGAMILHDLRYFLKEKTKAIFLFVVCSSSLITGGWWTLVNLNQNSNAAQLTALDSLYSYMVSAELESFEDFNCLLPPYCAVRKFIGPHQPHANRLILESFMRNPSQVFYYLKKADLLEPQLGLFLEQNYIYLGRGLFILKNERVEIPEPMRGILDVVPVNFGDIFGYDIEY